MTPKRPLKQIFLVAMLAAASLSTMAGTAGARGTPPSSRSAKTSHEAGRRSGATSVGGHRRRTSTRARIASTGSAVPAHIGTWAYDDCHDGGSGASATVVRAWVTYAEANCGPGGDAKARSDCHAGSTVFCQVIQYLDTNWIYPDGSPPWSSFNAAASTNWYLHTPGSQTTRVDSNGYGGGYLLNQTNPAVRSFFRSYARTNDNADDGLMMDDQAASLSSQLYYSTCGCKSTDQVTTTAALLAAHIRMGAEMTHSNGQPFAQIDNTLPPNPYQPQGLSMLNRSRTGGLVSEGAPESGGVLDPFYSTLLDQIAYVSDRTRGFVVPLSYGTAGASYQQQSRRVQEATMLLGFKPGRLVDWADLEEGSSNAGVWPEEGIYPTDPVQSMQAPGGPGCLAGTGNVCARGGHNDVQVAPGVYRREFSSCYDQRTPFGACAAIVNTTASPVTVQSSWLTRAYGHQITFDGGDVQSGGSINRTATAFTPDSTTVGADDATLLAS